MRVVGVAEISLTHLALVCTREGACSVVGECYGELVHVACFTLVAFLGAGCEHGKEVAELLGAVGDLEARRLDALHSVVVEWGMSGSYVNDGVGVSVRVGGRC